MDESRISDHLLHPLNAVDCRMRNGFQKLVIGLVQFFGGLLESTFAVVVLKVTTKLLKPIRNGIVRFHVVATCLA